MTAASEELTGNPASPSEVIENAATLCRRARELRAASAELSIKNTRIMRRADAAARRSLCIMLEAAGIGRNS